VEHYIGRVLEVKPYPEQAYKSCQGILSFARRDGTDRLTDACRWADNFGQYSFLTIEETLRKRLDHIVHQSLRVELFGESLRRRKGKTEFIL
jgi:hypothetical protein